MSSAVTSFSSRIRDAGDLERDSKLYGSFRSINKFDLEESKKRTDQQQQRRMSKHEDIFLEALIQPVREQRAAKEVIAPLPPSSSKSSASKDGQRKRSRKHHNHDKTSRDSSKQRPPRSDNESTEANNPSGSNDNDVDEFMESLRRRTSRNRRRRQNKENQEPIAAEDDNETPFGGSESKRPGLNSSFSGPITNDSSQINNGSRNRRNSLVVKRAFEEPEKRASGGADESVLVVNGAGNEIEVGVDQKKPTPRSTTASGSTPSTSRRGSVQQPATTTMTSDSRVIAYFSPLLKSNTLEFVLSPAPQMSNTIVNCKITCQKGIFTEYSFWLDGIVNQGRDLLVMKAHRRVTSTKSYYLITLVNYDNLGLRLEEQSACARVVSNIYRNKFKLELSNSSLSSPSSSPSSVVAINSSTSSSLATSSNRQLLSVSYKSTMGEPTKISANACLCGKENSEETGRVTYFLKNRAPVFDLHRRKYVLEYNGRAKKSSKHNFQVVDESRDTDEVLIQLGKLETGVYSCDYAFPLCALQAFGFALSSLCR